MAIPKLRISVTSKQPLLFLTNDFTLLSYVQLYNFFNQHFQLIKENTIQGHAIENFVSNIGLKRVKMLETT